MKKEIFLFIINCKKGEKDTLVFIGWGIFYLIKKNDLENKRGMWWIEGRNRKRYIVVRKGIMGWSKRI